VGRSLQGGGVIQPARIVSRERPEDVLSRGDSNLAAIIVSQPQRWPTAPDEDPIWGLVRIVIAQQVATRLACGIARRLLATFPTLSSPSRGTIPRVADLRALGLPQRRASSCVEILQRADEISESVNRGATWQIALKGIKGVGPWTLSTFRIMVLREPDVLPLGDIGLERAIGRTYGADQDIEKLAENWRPFRSVACWYLWRTLGNEQLG